MRLIRSKGVGVFFITQTPKDMPGDVLAQLGNRVQHALRAFTPDDEKTLRAAVTTYPKTDFYDIATLLTSIGIGEAAVTILSESGAPTPVVHTRLDPPRSRMGPTDDVDAAAKASPLYAKYGTRVDSQSAREILAARMAPPPAAALRARRDPQADRAAEGASRSRRRRARGGNGFLEIPPGTEDRRPGRPRHLRDAQEVNLTTLKDRTCQGKNAFCKPADHKHALSSRACAFVTWRFESSHLHSEEPIPRLRGDGRCRFPCG